MKHMNVKGIHRYTYHTSTLLVMMFSSYCFLLSSLYYIAFSAVDVSAMIPSPILFASAASTVHSEVENGECISDANLSAMSMSSSYTYNSFCSGLITYPFFVPASSSVDILNRQAISLSNNTILTLLPGSCQEQYKRLICASVYKECNPSANLRDNSTWTYTTESTTTVGGSQQTEIVPIFYKQPCMSLCTEIFGESSQCGKIIDQLQLNSSEYNSNYNSYIYNCSSMYEIDGGDTQNGNSVSIINTNYLDKNYPFYNSTGNGLYCNNMDVSVAIVANQTEDYKGSICQNLFDYPNFITSSYASFSTINSNNQASDSSIYQSAGANVNIHSSSNQIYIPPSSSIINSSSTDGRLPFPFQKISNNEEEVLNQNQFAPLLPPYYVQSYFETSLHEFLEAFPPFLTLQCQEALRMLLCAATFMQPARFQSETTDLPNISLPIVPDITLCNLISESCSNAYHTGWNSSYSTFNTILQQVVNDHCSNAKVNSPYKLPAESIVQQPINQYFSLNEEQNDPIKKSQNILSLQTLDYGIMNFNTSSNQMNVSSISSLLSPDLGVPQFTTKYGITFSITCPIGFLYGAVEDINAPSDRNSMVKGTGCVNDCQVPIYTRQEFNATNIVLQVFVMVSLIGSIFLVVTFYLFRRKKRQPHVICISLSSAFYTIVQIPTLYAVPYPERYCIGNGTPISQSNGWTSCLFQAIFIQYFGLTTVLFWLIIASDLYLKIVWRFRDLKIYERNSILIGWILPIFPVIIIAAQKDTFGYASPLPWCYMGSWVTNHYDLYFFFLPILIITIMGSFFAFRVIYEIYKVHGGTRIETSANNAQHSRTKAIKLLIKRSKNVLLFVFFFLLIVYTLFSLRFIQYWYGDDLETAALNWQDCVFSNFLFASQSQADITCGRNPSYTLSFGIFFVSSLVTLCGTILLIPIFGIVGDNKELWRDFLYKRVYRDFQLNHPNSCLTVYCCTPLCNHKFFGCHERARKRVSFVTPAQRRATQRASLLKAGIEKSQMKQDKFTLAGRVRGFFQSNTLTFSFLSSKQDISDDENASQWQSRVELSNNSKVIKNPILEQDTITIVE